jgi:hypothetical protein
MNRTTTKLDLATLTMTALLATGSAGAETLHNLEAVDTNGFSAWIRAFPLTITGVVLNDPAEMLDATPNFVPWDSGAGQYRMGGQWQVLIQAVWPGDRGGVECWMGQNYGNLPWLHSSALSYDNAAWATEVDRVSRDPATGHVFRRGDLVTVTANGSLFYGGMQNINEEHSLDPALDFTISLVSSNFGLPAPEVLSLSSILSTNLGPTGHYDIFDATRATGGEHWQGMRVRLNGLTLASASGWGTNAAWAARYCTATDGDGRQLPLVHPLYDLGPAPTNRFDAIGILLQESGSGTDGTFGYELFVQEIEPSVPAAVAIALKPVITWPASLVNYQLQRRDSLASTNWTAVTTAPVLANGQNTVIVEAPAAEGFYRLLRVQ